MLTKEQIKLINEKASIFEPCVAFARKFLVLPSIQIAFNDCPSAMFRTMDNAAESHITPDGSGCIYFNAPWFAERVTEHQDDVEFFLFHELRHLHQLNQIKLYVANEKTREPKDIVKLWKNCFENYQRNEGGKSQLANVTQEVEVDANAYGILLEVLYRNGRTPLLSLPGEAFDPANERLQRYYDTLPEFRQLV